MRRGLLGTVLLAGVSLSPALACAQGGVRPPGGDLPPGLREGQHEIVADSVRLWYRVAGAFAEGLPPVVFLHGGPGQGSEHFATLVGPTLEPALRMVYFDQRGSGRSGRPPDGEYSIARLIEDIEGLRSALGVPRIVVVGHSFGGLLAFEYAAQYPQRVAGVVFTAGVWDFPFQCRLRLKTLAERRPAAYARVRGDTLTADGARRSDCDLEFRAFAGADERDAYNNEAMFPDSTVRLRPEHAEAEAGVRNSGEVGRALFAAGLLEYRFTRFAQVTMPALVIAGRHDGAARPEGLRELARRLPDATFLEYERSGHFVYLDETDRFGRDVTAFVRRVAAPAR